MNSVQSCYNNINKAGKFTMTEIVKGLSEHSKQEWSLTAGLSDNCSHPPH